MSPREDVDRVDLQQRGAAHHLPQVARPRLASRSRCGEALGASAVRRASANDRDAIMTDVQRSNLDDEASSRDCRHRKALPAAHFLMRRRKPC